MPTYPDPWPLRTSTTLWSILWSIIIIDPFLVTSVLGKCNFHNPNLVTFIHFFNLKSPHFYCQGRSSVPPTLQRNYYSKVGSTGSCRFQFRLCTSAYIMNNEFTRASHEISASSVFLNLIQMSSKEKQLNHSKFCQSDWIQRSLVNAILGGTIDLPWL